jgi:hypothetical protein
VNVDVGSGVDVSAKVRLGKAVRVSVDVGAAVNVDVGNAIAVCVASSQADVSARDLTCDVSRVGVDVEPAITPLTALTQKTELQIIVITAVAIKQPKGIFTPFLAVGNDSIFSSPRKNIIITFLLLPSC